MVELNRIAWRHSWFSYILKVLGLPTARDHLLVPIVGVGK